MWECYFCGEKTRESYSDYYCPNCVDIQRIVKLYGSEEIKSILETCCLRNKKQVGYKVDKVLKEVDIDKAHGLEPPETRSKKKNIKN